METTIIAKTWQWHADFSSWLSLTKIILFFYYMTVSCLWVPKLLTFLRAQPYPHYLSICVSALTHKVLVLVFVMRYIFLPDLCLKWVDSCGRAYSQLAVASLGELSYIVPGPVVQARVGFDGPDYVIDLSYNPISSIIITTNPVIPWQRSTHQVHSSRTL